MRRTYLAVILLTSAFFLMILTTDAHADDSLVGTWRLVSASSSTDNGNTDSEVYGGHPTGVMVFTADGRMMTLIAMGDRKALSVPDRVTAPMAERAEAFSTFIAYEGRYSF